MVVIIVIPVKMTGTPKYRIHVTFDSTGWEERGQPIGANPPVYYGIDIICTTDAELMEYLESVSGLGHAAEVFTVEAE